MENLVPQLTLLIVAAVSNVALAVNWSINRSIPGLKLICLGFMIMTPGFVLIAFSQSTTLSPLILIAISLTFSGRIPILLGLAEFWNQERSKLVIACVSIYIVTIAVFAFFVVTDSTSRLPAVFYWIAQLTFNIAAIYVIRRGLIIEQRLRPATAVSSHSGAYLAIALFSANIVADMGLMYLRTNPEIASAATITALALLVAVITISVFAFALIIMSMEELAVEYKENSVYDPITSILNHRTFVEVGQRVLGVALRYSQPVSMLTIELENMDKIIKDYGFKAGNHALRQFAHAITDRRRNEDVLARSGFKDFRMLLPGIDEKGARVVMEKIRAEIESQKISLDNSEVSLQLHICSVTCKEEDLHLQQMMQEGDVELYRLKQQQVAPAVRAPAS